MREYRSVQEKLQLEPKTWLITGVAGFIGSNLLRGVCGGCPSVDQGDDSAGGCLYQRQW